MLPVSQTTSPQNSLTDMFLNACVGPDQTDFFPNSINRLDNTFSTILNNNIQQFRASADSSSSSSSLPQTNEPVRSSSIEELTRQVEEIGIPLGGMAMSPTDLPKLEKVLTESGYSTDEVKKVMERLSEGPLTMDRVLATATSVKKHNSTSLSLKEESISQLGKFLQEAGLNPDQVKEALTQLKAGEQFGAKELKNLLLKHGSLNLHKSVMSGVDQENLNQFLASIGASDQDLKNFQTLLQKTDGKMSLEGLLGFLRSVDRPNALQKDQLKNINDMVKNLIMSNTLRAQPHFNRIVSLLDAMGDPEVNRDFISSNPAVQALRSGTLASRTLTQNANGLGDASQAQSDMSGDASDDAFGGLTDSEKSLATAKSSSGATSISRLSTSVAQQVAEKMVYQIRNNQHRMQIQLNPPELGRLDINLVMKHNGLHASIVAETQFGKAALEDQMSQLKAAMAEQGLELQRFDVALGYENRQSNFSDSQERFNGSLRSQAGNAEFTEPEVDITTNTPSASWSNSRIDRHI